METINIKNQTKETVNHVAAYAHNQMEISKLLLLKKTAQASSFLMFIFIASLLLFFMSFMLSIAAGIFLGDLIGSYPLSFLIIAVVNLLFLILLTVFRKSILDNVVLRQIIKQM